MKEITFTCHSVEWWRTRTLQKISLFISLGSFWFQWVAGAIDRVCARIWLSYLCHRRTTYTTIFVVAHIHIFVCFCSFKRFVEHIFETDQSIYISIHTLAFVSSSIRIAMDYTRFGFLCVRAHSYTNTKMSWRKKNEMKGRMKHTHTHKEIWRGKKKFTMK